MSFVMQAAQIMEDVWLSADLDTRWSHPLNEGWMNAFQRWTRTSSFRAWWPILRPSYTPGFRDFVKDHFGLKLNEAARGQNGSGARLELRPFRAGDEAGLALAQLSCQPKQGQAKLANATSQLVYELELELELSPKRYSAPIQVGHLRYAEGAGRVAWHADDFYVLPMLSGAGIHSRFLDAVIARFGYRLPLYVLVDGTSSDEAAEPRARSVLRSPASRSALVQQIAFYKSRGFGYQDQPASQGAPQETWLVRPRSRVCLRQIDFTHGKLILQGDDLEALGQQLGAAGGTSGNLEISFKEPELENCLRRLVDKGVTFDASTEASAAKFPALKPEFEPSG